MLMPAQNDIDKRLLAGADIVVAIFGTRIGTPTEDAVSGTVGEIKRHVAERKATMIYFSEVPVPPSSIDQQQYRAVQDFKAEIQNGGTYWSFTSHEDFRSKFGHHLDIELNKPEYRWLQLLEVPDEKQENISAGALQLLSAAAREDDGMLLLQDTVGGIGLRVGDREFTDGTARSAAKLRAVIAELVNARMLETVNKHIYRLTDAGFAMADAEEAKLPVVVSLSIEGDPESQHLDIETSKDITLQRLEYQTSTFVSVSTQQLSGNGRSLKVEFSRDQIAELYQSPRADKAAYDLSGPANLKLSFFVEGKPKSVTLPVLIVPKFVKNTRWITFTGSGTYSA